MGLFGVCVRLYGRNVGIYSLADATGPKVLRLITTLPFHPRSSSTYPVRLAVRAPERRLQLRQWQYVS